MNVQDQGFFRQFFDFVSLQNVMGELINLAEWRSDHLRARADASPAFFFDLGCPFSYLSAERVERKLGEVEWIPASTAEVKGTGARLVEDPDALRELAEAQADALRLPLVWPDSFPDPVPRAQRAASYAVAIGAGPRFALAASRLAFCGGFDLSDPETLVEAAAASAVPLGTCLKAAGDPSWDAPLRATAHGLQMRGIRELPAFRVGRRWFSGNLGLVSAACGLDRSQHAGRPLAPVG